MTLIRRALLVIGAASMACCGQDHAFRIDKRVSITAPRDRAVVELPVKLEWRAKDLDHRSFAVFVDRAPAKPGKRVVAAVTETDAVYVTTDTALVIDDVEEGQGDGRERHRATIVLLDPSSRRVGESAWDVVFEVERVDES